MCPITKFVLKHRHVKRGKDYEKYIFNQISTERNIWWGRINKEKNGSSFFRETKGVQLNPYKKDYDDNYFLKKYVLQGWAPVKPLIDYNTQITAFGSCFAQYISNHLEKRKYNLTAEKSPDIYISYMGEGM